MESSSCDEYISLQRCNPSNKMAADVPSITKQIISFVRNGKTIRALLLTDSKLPGGVKERILMKYLPTRSEDEFIYVTAPNGYAQIALARVGKSLGKSVTIFTMFPSPETREVERLGGKVKYINGGMSDLYDAADAYMKPGMFRIPFGANNPELRRIFVDELKRSLRGIRQPRRLWLVSGSGFTLSVLQEIWPETQYMIIQVAKAIPRELIRKRDTLFISPYKFLEHCKIPPPYSSPPSYDAKLWEFFIKYGQNGDYIWNTAAEIDDGKSVCRQVPSKR